MKRIANRLAVISFTAVGLLAQAASADVNIIGFSGIFADNYKIAVLDPFTAKTGIKVNYNPIQLSAQNLGLLRAERNNPSMDISLMDAMVARTGNTEGVFAKLDPTEVPVMSELYENAFINPGYGPAVTFDNTVIIYNKEAVTTEPTALADLWKEEFQGRVAMYSAPEVGSLMNMILLNRSLGADEKETVKPAIDKLAELSPHVQTWQPNPETYTVILNGTADVGAGWNARAQYYEKDSNGKLGVAIAAEGTMLQINTINLVEGAKNKADALAFINYALSAEAQTAFTNQMFYAPVNSKAAPSEEALKRTVASEENRSRIQPLDWAFFNANREGWLQEWRRHILSKN